MKTGKITSIAKFIALSLPIIILGLILSTSSVNAQVSASVKANASVNVTKLSADRVAKGDKELDKRVESLNKLNDRVGEMKRLTDAQKSAIQGEIKAVILNLTTLKAKIDAEGTTGTTSLKEDLQSITTNYRVYALIMPQIHILAALDRIGNLTDAFAILGTKIEGRIAEAKTAGKDVAALEKNLTDFRAKITDENAEAQKALNLITPLAPDNGDKTVMTANKKALTDARAAIKKAHQDIMDARKIAGTMVKALGDNSLKASVNGSASTTVSH